MATRSKKQRKERRRRHNNEGSITLRKYGRYQVALPVGRTPEGKLRRINKYAKSEDEARMVLTEMLYLHGKGELAGSEVITFGRLAGRWLQVRKARVAPTTYHSYSQLLEDHILPVLGNLRIDRIRPSHIDDLKISLSDKGLSKRTIHYALWLTRGPLDDAVRQEQLRKNPVDGVNFRYKQKRTPNSTWTADQAARFLRAAKGERLYAAFYLLLSLGLRRGEVFGLKWDAVDLDEGYLRIELALRSRPGGGTEFAPPKTDSSRRLIYLSADVVEVLRHHRAQQDADREHAAEAWKECGVVFATQIGTRCHPDNLKRYMKRVCKRANVPVIRIHDLRHTYASLALSRHVDNKVLSERLGHTDVKFTRSVYQHTYEEQHRAAALPMDQLLGSEHSEN